MRHTVLRKRLKARLAAQDLAQQNQIYSAFDIVGSVAILKTPQNNPQAAQTAAGQIMSTHRSVKTVLAQTGGVDGDFRTRKLTLVAGENKTKAKYRESSCTFAVDLENCYFSPRLLFERTRIARLVGEGEIVVNMFAGVGCFSIILAKNVPTAKVYSIDVNPTAYECMVQNVKANRVYGRVFPLLGDAKTVVETQLLGMADRVLMPLPELAIEYLPAAVSALKKQGGWIHYYGFEHAVGDEEPVEKSKQKLAEKLGSLGVGFVFGLGRVVRSTGPNWVQTAVDVCIS